MLNAMRHAKEPVILDEAPCQDVVHLASDRDFDIRTLLPAPTNTAEDAGPYFNMAVLRGTDSETGKHDVTTFRREASKGRSSNWSRAGRSTSM